MSRLNDLQNQILKLAQDDQNRLANWLLQTTNYKSLNPTSDPSSGIEKTPEICGGKPRIKGTRIPAWLLEQMRQAGSTEAEILRCYPTLHAADLVNAWRYIDSHKVEIQQQIRENEEA